MSQNTAPLPSEESKREPATVELEDGSCVPRYGVTPYGGVPASGDQQNESEDEQ